MTKQKFLFICSLIIFNFSCLGEEFYVTLPITYVLNPIYEPLKCCNKRHPDQNTLWINVHIYKKNEMKYGKEISLPLYIFINNDCSFKKENARVHYKWCKDCPNIVYIIDNWFAEHINGCYENFKLESKNKSYQFCKSLYNKLKHLIC